MESVGSARQHYSGYPESFDCPINHVMMEEPVVAHCGHSFEEKAIKGWIQKQVVLKQAPTCPLDRHTITIEELAPNFALKDAIIRWQAEQNLIDRDKELIEEETGRLINWINPTNSNSAPSLEIVGEYANMTQQKIRGLIVNALQTNNIKIQVFINMTENYLNQENLPGQIQQGLDKILTVARQLQTDSDYDKLKTSHKSLQKQAAEGAKVLKHQEEQLKATDAELRMLKEEMDAAAVATMIEAAHAQAKLRKVQVIADSAIIIADSATRRSYVAMGVAGASTVVTVCALGIPGAAARWMPKIAVDFMAGATIDLAKKTVEKLPNTATNAILNLGKAAEGMPIQLTNNVATAHRAVSIGSKAATKGSIAAVGLSLVKHLK